MRVDPIRVGEMETHCSHLTFAKGDHAVFLEKWGRVNEVEAGIAHGGRAHIAVPCRDALLAVV